MWFFVGLGLGVVLGWGLCAVMVLGSLDEREK
jgi:hypothetical protein